MTAGVNAATLAAAKWLRNSRGFSVIVLDHPEAPIGNDPAQAGKLPIGKWKRYQTELASDAYLDASLGNGTKRNIGIVTGLISGVVVIDSDDADGDAWADEHLPATPMMTKTAKGLHRFYRHPGIPVPSKNRVFGKDGPKIDRKSEGGFVVAPPSLHYSGAVYARVGPWPPVAELPVFDPAWLPPDEPAAKPKPKPKPAAKPRPASHDRTRKLLRASSYVEQVPGAVTGLGGDDRTFQLACRLVRGFDLDRNDALMLLLEFNARCSPPWTVRELEAKLDNAVAHGTEAYGSKLNEDTADGGTGDPDTDPAADEETDTAADSDPATPADADPPWARALPDLIAEADQTTDEPPLITDFLLACLITLLHGQPRDWKTLVALCVAISVATGRALFGMSRLSVPAARNVLYLTEEDGKRRVTKRLQSICAGIGCAPPANLFVAAGTGFSLDDPECQGKLAAFVTEHKIALVILDPLRSLSACVDQGPKELRPLTLALRSLMRETGCTILAVHHDSKPLALGVDARRRPQRASGGAVFSIADSPIGVDVLPDKRRLLTPTAWKFAEDPPAIVLSIESRDGFLRLVGADADGATTANEADLSGRVLAFLIANPRSSGTTIYKGLKTRKQDVAGCLERLAGIGKIDSVRMGRAVLWFVIDEKGPDPCGTHRKHPENDPNPMGPDAGPIPADDEENLNDPMGPDVGTHADPCTTTGPDTGGGPRHGSRSYIGPILGTHATPDRELLSDPASAATSKPNPERAPW